MPSQLRPKFRQADLRIIPRHTILACIRIFKDAGDRIRSCYPSTQYRDAKAFDFPDGFTLPEYGTALQWMDALVPHQLHWPLIVEVGSQVDTGFTCILRDAKTWISRNQQAGISSYPLEDVLVAFPTFRSHHLNVNPNGHIQNRWMVTLFDESAAKIVAQDPDTTTLRMSIYQFRHLLLAAQWMCEDPEQRLYTKISDPPALNNTKNGGRDYHDDAVSVQTGSRSQMDSEALLTPTPTRDLSPSFGR